MENKNKKKTKLVIKNIVIFAIQFRWAVIQCSQFHFVFWGKRLYLLRIPYFSRSKNILARVCNKHNCKKKNKKTIGSSNQTIKQSECNTLVYSVCRSHLHSNMFHNQMRLPKLMPYLLTPSFIFFFFISYTTKWNVQHVDYKFRIHLTWFRLNVLLNFIFTRVYSLKPTCTLG